MRLTLKRFHYGDKSTIGRLYANDVLLNIVTLEDVVRELPFVPVDLWKIPKETAIPCGTYKIEIRHSTRFKRDLPLLVNVPGFESVLIHPGNKPEDTEGCLLVGRAWVGGDVISESKDAFDELLAMIRKETRKGEDVFLEVVNT